jgi:hypothetical protein
MQYRWYGMPLAPKGELKIYHTQKALQQFAARLWFYTPIKPGLIIGYYALLK